MAATLPLAGLNVLDLTWVVAGPAVGRALADFGATVVRVETSHHPETARLVGPFHKNSAGVEQSALYGNVNAGKLGLALDLSFQEARAVVRDLVCRADVVAESFSPGVMERWELDYNRLRAIRPDLVMLSTSLMGQSGPYSQLAGYGNIGASMAGFQYLAGWQDRPPLGPFGPYTDYVGPRFALVALLAALDRRNRTGEGCWLDVSQAEAGMHFLAPALLDYAATGRVAERNGNRDAAMAPHGVYTCLPDDRGARTFVAIAVRDDAEWTRLARLIGGDELAADARFATTALRLVAQDALDELITAWTAGRTARSVEELLQAEGIPAYVAQTGAGALADPQLQLRRHFLELEHPLHGRTVVEAPRYLLSRTPGDVRRCAPTYGRDNRHVLNEILGYDDERIAALSDMGALE